MIFGAYLRKITYTGFMPSRPKIPFQAAGPIICKKRAAERAAMSENGWFPRAAGTIFCGLFIVKGMAV
jgi:hypothetical protein